LSQKYDFAVLPRLARLLKRRRIDAVVTVGTGGDKMFWGRLAGSLAGVPVLISALHSTGLPDRVELPNRLLAPLTDAFVAVARPHARYLAEHEGCPRRKVRVVPNGVDVDMFRPREPDAKLRRQLDLPSGTPVAAIVAALRPEKNHELFLEAAALVRRRVPEAVFLIVGDGPRRTALESLRRKLSLGDAVRLLGTRDDVSRLLGLTDVLMLTSHMEANPVSILEGMACGKPVVATRVGSVPENVIEGVTGHLTTPGDAKEIADRVSDLLIDRDKAAAMGRHARQHVVDHGSCDRMVTGYQDLIAEIYTSKCPTPAGRGRVSSSSLQDVPTSATTP